MSMSVDFIVQTLPVRGVDGAILGWVRLEADADIPAGRVRFHLRDGSAWDQDEAMRRIEADPGLLYPTQHEAARDGLERLLALEQVPIGREA
jgi:hypothetical protein